jgi:hypothetical protein
MRMMPQTAALHAFLKDAKLARLVSTNHRATVNRSRPANAEDYYKISRAHSAVRVPKGHLSFERRQH